MTDKEKADLYRRQLGGAEAALRRERQRADELEGRAAELGRIAERALEENRRLRDRLRGLGIEVEE